MDCNIWQIIFELCIGLHLFLCLLALREAFVTTIYSYSRTTERGDSYSKLAVYLSAKIWLACLGQNGVAPYHIQLLFRYSPLKGLCLG